MFEECGRRRTSDNGRRRPAYPISSPMSLRLRSAKISKKGNNYAMTSPTEKEKKYIRKSAYFSSLFHILTHISLVSFFGT